jgi:hypothetical protein
MHPAEVAVVGAVLLLLLPPWLAARDVLGQPRAAWSAAGHGRLRTLALVVALPLLGPAWYLRRIRPALRRPTG